MPTRALVRLPIPPGAAGVEVLRRGLSAALEGGPAVAPTPVPSVTVSAGYVGRVAAAVAAGDPRRPLEDDRAAAVVATSGSTGDPRGVLLPAEALLAVARGRGAPDGTHYLVALPVTSVGGLQVVVRAMLAGTRPETLESVGGAAPFTPAVFVAAADALAERAAGAPLRTSLVPAQLSRLLADPPATRALARFDEVLLGGAAAGPHLRAAAAAAGVRVVRTYGMTETAGGCVYDGVPLPGVTADVAGDGGPGEVVIGGPVVALGYRLRPEDTAARFSGGRFRTGDLGEWDTGGRLRVTGRLDDVVQVRGTSVAVGAVERALGACGDVRAGAVVALEGADEGARLVAFVVPAEGARALVTTVRDAVREDLGPAAVPAEVHLVESLPLLPNGKVDRVALGALAAGG